MKQRLLLLIGALSGAAQAQTHQPVIKPVSEPTAVVVAGTTFTGLNGEQARVTGQLMMLLGKESDFPAVMKKFSLTGSNSLAGVPVYIVTAPTGIDLNALRSRMLKDPRVKEVTIDTTAKHYLPQ